MSIKRSGFTLVEVLIGTTILAFAIVCIAQMVVMFVSQSAIHNRTVALQYSLEYHATSFENTTHAASSYIRTWNENYLGTNYVISGTNYRGGASYPLEAITFTGQYQSGSQPERSFTYEAIRIHP
jgi:prepilin-type N-terminal cleavage/methylation domain-containing protein